MAWSAHKDPEQIREKFESDEEMDRKARILADYIKQSKHFIAFTGAGVSTSAGIPDYRGPQGVWTLRAQGRRPIGGVSSLQAIPTPSHMSLVELQDRGILKYLVSQNTDGLHRKSGIRPEMIAELHGNSNREYCKSCGKEYIRDYRAVANYRKNGSINDHRTGRKCAVCGDDLHDSIINFGESLPEEALTNAFNHARQADLCLVLGSSCTVSPANSVPERVGRNGSAHLVICNLQDTPLDHLCSLRVHAKTDEFMQKVLGHLELSVPAWKLHRRVAVRLEKNTLEVRGVDLDGTSASLFQRVEVNGAIKEEEPFVFPLGAVEVGQQMKIVAYPMGWYGEPPVTIEHTVQRPFNTFYALDYSPGTGEWKVTSESSAAAGS